MSKLPKREAKAKTAPKKRAARAKGAATPAKRSTSAEQAATKSAAKKLDAKKVGTKKIGTKKVALKKAAGARPAPDLSGANAGVLDRLFDVVTARRDADPNISHSARLLSRGTAKVAQKFGEEAVECLIEAVSGNAPKLIGESADVLYHLIVMWVDAGVSPNEVWSELQRREGTSGLVEKASRQGHVALPRQDD